MKLIAQPISDTTLGEILNLAFKGEYGKFSSLRAAVAFVKSSGVQHIADSLVKFGGAAERVEIVVGVDHQGTTSEGLGQLLKSVGPNGKVYVNHDENTYVTFHPKVFLFESEGTCLLIVGSGNLTEGGLYTNDECTLVAELDCGLEEDANLLKKATQALNAWRDEDSETVTQLTNEFIEKLIELGYVSCESAQPGEPRDETSSGATTSVSPVTDAQPARLFGKLKRKRPKRISKITTSRVAGATLKLSDTAEGDTVSGFVMTMMRTDVGTGQTTPGTSRRSPEVFIPLMARNANPEFWGWPESFQEDELKPGKFDRKEVRMYLGGQIVQVNMMTWPDKHDFRLRSEALRSAGAIGDLLRMERPSTSGDYDYYVTIIPQGTPEHDDFLELCTQTTRNSERKWGYY